MMEDQKNKEFATQKWDSEIQKEKDLEQKYYDEIEQKNAPKKKRMFVKRPKKDM